jgi:hypothetical protein
MKFHERAFKGNNLKFHLIRRMLEEKDLSVIKSIKREIQGRSDTEHDCLATPLKPATASVQRRTIEYDQVTFQSRKLACIQSSEPSVKRRQRASSSCEHFKHKQKSSVV